MQGKHIQRTYVTMESSSSNSNSKEEAEKAVEEAEKLFISGDLLGAREQLFRAEQFPSSLPHFPAFHAAYNVHIAAAAAAASSLPSALAIIGYDPLVDRDKADQRYKELRRLTDPQNNPSAAAEGAFRMVNASWEMANGRGADGGFPVAEPGLQIPGLCMRLCFVCGLMSAVLRGPGRSIDPCDNCGSESTFYMDGKIGSA